MAGFKWLAETVIDIISVCTVIITITVPVVKSCFIQVQGLCVKRPPGEYADLPVFQGLLALENNPILRLFVLLKKSLLFGLTNAESVVLLY